MSLAWLCKLRAGVRESGCVGVVVVAHHVKSPSRADCTCFPHPPMVPRKPIVQPKASR